MVLEFINLYSKNLSKVTADVKVTIAPSIKKLSNV